MLTNTDFWRGKRVFLTGHTGFKGSWLSLWLQQLGAHVHGYSLPPPSNPSLFTEASVERGMTSTIADIRDLKTLQDSMKKCEPEILIHMAAQPLVRQSYKDPIETYSTNVMGTVHVFEAARQAPSLKAIVNVTTDKCYENKEWHWGYRENEPMGGLDPYSNSKGCAELVTSSYRASFFSGENTAALASARAGNVIGGGDWADDRLIPDLLKAFTAKQSPLIRNPLAIRPWQHVLEPLSGYLVLAQRLYQEGGKYSEGWNFGPNDQDARPVGWIADQLAELWGDKASWAQDTAIQPHEANLLKLDISKANNRLGWTPNWSIEQTLSKIVNWQKSWLTNSDMRVHCEQEISAYMQAMSASLIKP